MGFLLKLFIDCDFGNLESKGVSVGKRKVAGKILQTPDIVWVIRAGGETSYLGAIACAMTSQMQRTNYQRKLTLRSCFTFSDNRIHNHFPYSQSLFETHFSMGAKFLRKLTFSNLKLILICASFAICVVTSCCSLCVRVFQTETLCAVSILPRFAPYPVN